MNNMGCYINGRHYWVEPPKQNFLKDFVKRFDEMVEFEETVLYPNHQRNLGLIKNLAKRAFAEGDKSPSDQFSRFEDGEGIIQVRVGTGGVAPAHHFEHYETTENQKIFKIRVGAGGVIGDFGKNLSRFYIPIEREDMDKVVVKDILITPLVSVEGINLQLCVLEKHKDDLSSYITVCFLSPYESTGEGFDAGTELIVKRFDFYI